MFKKFKRENPAYVIDANPFKVELYHDEKRAERCKAVVTLLRGNARYEFNSATNAYWFFMSSVNDVTAVKTYLCTIALSMEALASDPTFQHDVSDALVAYIARKEQEGEENAARVTQEQDDIDQDLMEGAARYAEEHKDEG